MIHLVEQILYKHDENFVRYKLTVKTHRQTETIYVHSQSRRVGAPLRA